MGNQANPTDIGMGVMTGGLWNAGKALGGSGIFDQNQVNAGIPAAMQPLFNQANSMVQGQVGQVLNPATYTMTPMQGQIQNAASSYLGNAVPSMQNYIQSVLSPNFANPMTNPNMAGALSGAQDQFTQGLGKSLDILGSQFGLSGQVPQRSGAAAQGSTNVTRQALGDYGNTVSNLLMNQYNQSIQQQMQALSQGGQVGNILNSMGGVASLPQQLATTQQQGQLSLDQIPFSMLMSLMSQTPLAYPNYQPSQFSQIMQGLGGLGQLGQGVGAIMAA